MLWVWIYGKDWYFSGDHRFGGPPENQTSKWWVCLGLSHPTDLNGGLNGYDLHLQLFFFGAWQVVKPMGMDDLWKCLVIQVVIFWFSASGLVTFGATPWCRQTNKWEKILHKLLVGGYVMVCSKRYVGKFSLFFQKEPTHSRNGGMLLSEVGGVPLKNTSTSFNL